ncbi:hypothetical protein [Streptomyces monashensis]|uniref:DUF4232 domain-containing protein n=1 Tax=Streptomyces monashensis TaxID=1678012 RepID=A0A1S2P8P7_9ACTN|nr:hypothetical protein [Streptomyces monashensis]OIJ90203.1 hypothetical protein BIV23_41080 [Streptomyces monashensis]
MNHGPDEKNAEGLGPDPDGLGAELGGLGDDELALRRMLHSVVDDIEPRSGALEHLRRAVPARRARKRQAVVGMAAAALFFGTAIPALVHVSESGGSHPDTAMAGQSSQAQGGTGQDRAQGGDTGGAKDGGGASARPGRQPGRTGEKGRGGGAATGSAGADPSATLSSSGVPVCKAAQLGSATGSAAAPDTAGVVYGTFQVTNTSSAACTVGGAGKVTPTAQGAADPARITTARHVAGDAATGLPDPALEVSGLVLRPGAAYEEKFAFVPSQTCPTSGGSTTTGGSTTGSTGGPSPDPSPTPEAGASGTTGSGSGGTTSGTTTQLGTEQGLAQGSVVVTHTAQGGSPTASATVPQACAGTVYYTGVLAAS